MVTLHYNYFINNISLIQSKGRPQNCAEIRHWVGWWLNTLRHFSCCSCATFPAAVAPLFLLLSWHIHLCRSYLHIWYFVIYWLFINQACINSSIKRYRSQHRIICWAKYALIFFMYPHVSSLIVVGYINTQNRKLIST